MTRIMMGISDFILMMWPLWLVLILCAVGVRAEDMDIEVSFCQFQLPDVILNGYVSFNLIYKFDVDPDGKPVHITPVLDHFNVGKDQVKDCLRTWRLPDWRGAKKCWVHFVWQHARGWVWVTINGPGVRLKLNVVGDPPYLKRLIRDDEKTDAPRPPGQRRDEGHSADAGLRP